MWETYGPLPQFDHLYQEKGLPAMQFVKITVAFCHCVHIVSIFNEHLAAAHILLSSTYSLLHRILILFSKPTTQLNKSLTSAPAYYHNFQKMAKGLGSSVSNSKVRGSIPSPDFRSRN